MFGKKKLIIILCLVFVISLLSGCTNNGKVVEKEVEKKDVVIKEDWPVRPIRFILPVSPGGLLDTGLRQMQPYLEKELGVPIVIDNRPGGQSMLAVNLLLKEEPDGYTVGYLGFPHTEISLAMMDTEITTDSFEYLAINQGDIGEIRVHKDSPFKTFEELLEYAVANPGKLSVSVSEMLAPHAFYMYELGKALGTSFKIVDFGGGGPARMALVGKQVDISATNVHASLHIADQTRVLAVTAEENKWPEISENAPTSNDVLDRVYKVTVPDIGGFYGFATSAGLKKQYPERFEKLTQALKNVVNNPEYMGKLKEMKDDTKVVWMDSDEVRNLAEKNYKNYFELKDAFKDIHKN